MYKINKQKGFTLIELMVVISVVSLISSILTYSTSEAKAKADDSKMIQESQQVEKAVQLYKNDTGGMVPGAGSLSSEDKGKMHSEGSTAYNTAMQDLVSAGYYPKIPRSSSGNSYAYMVAPDGQSAVFSAVLKKTNTGGGSSGSAKNKCDIVDSSITFGNCSIVSYESNSQSLCTSRQYDSNTQMCFVVDDSAIMGNCACNYQVSNTTSINPSFPNQLCANNFYVSFGRCVMAPMNRGTYLCSYTGGNSVCGGGSNQDYCTCI